MVKDLIVSSKIQLWLCSNTNNIILSYHKPPNCYTNYNINIKHVLVSFEKHKRCSKLLHNTGLSLFIKTESKTYLEILIKKKNWQWPSIHPHFTSYVEVPFNSVIPFIQDPISKNTSMIHPQASAHETIREEELFSPAGLSNNVTLIHQRSLWSQLRVASQATWYWHIRGTVIILLSITVTVLGVKYWYDITNIP